MDNGLPPPMAGEILLTSFGLDWIGYGHTPDAVKTVLAGYPTRRRGCFASGQDWLQQRYFSDPGLKSTFMSVRYSVESDFSFG